ncbi:MAG: hypothetical protein COA96_10350 [SAR86 cluster bacterium]|uniref:Uncharacterized protein n=1 Tax=SAR86 cluster bacterium TaxID=2030880 RepID=A0A2A5AXV3_9GAMM|nr:MAG: hypothetical protein COA96_10350 [SAR86 cluster bacterium]
MSDHIIKTGCIPYDDGSGFEITIQIEPPSKFSDYVKVVINPDSEFTDFNIDEWPTVRSAINRAVKAHDMLTASETPKN